jgi:hypothetical protein
MNALSDFATLNHAPGPIRVAGAFLDEFDIVGNMPADQVPAAIERDRPYFVARPGFYRKLLPLIIGNDGAAHTGGRYLFQTRIDADAFGRWLADEFVLDGTHFVDRPWVRNLTGSAFDVIGAHDFKDVHKAQTVVRVERWALEPGHDGDLVRGWDAMRDAAEASGLASLWLLHAGDRNEAAIVSVIDRVADSDRDAPDYASIRELESRDSTAAPLNGRPWARKTADLTSWVYTLWFAPNHRPLHLWPNSPPFPGLDSDRTQPAQPNAEPATTD